MRKRNHAVYVRYNDAEYDQLTEKVRQSGQTLLSYIIHTSLTGKISSAEEVMEFQKKNQLLADIATQLRGLGTNLNQLARTANRFGALPSENILIEMADEISELKKETEEQWRSTRQSISQQRLTQPCETASDMS